MTNSHNTSQIIRRLAFLDAGVSSVVVKGDDKVEVVGNGIDVVVLTTCLRKRMRRCPVNIDTVETVDEKKEEKKKEEETWPKIVTTYPLLINEPRQPSDCCLM